MSEKTQVSGFSFTEIKPGEFIVRQGQPILPHRLELIKTAIKRNRPQSEIIEMFFNFTLPGCINETSKAQLMEELNLFDSFIRKGTSSPKRSFSIEDGHEL